MKKLFVVMALFSAMALATADVQACVTSSKPIKLEERLYNREFTNKCDNAVTFRYKFWNGKKWIPVSYHLGAHQSVTLSAGVDGRITDFEE